MVAVRIILSGCCGAMGRAITQAAGERGDVSIVAGIDPNAGAAGYPVFEAPCDCRVDADVIVDFSHTSALPDLLAFAEDKNLPIVLATTGYSEGEISRIKQTAGAVPVFYTGNMSLVINLMQELCRIAARVLGGNPGFDIEIIERHHNKKIDAPSGTALMLADSVASVLETKPQYVYDRQSKRERRAKNEIGIHAVRAGTIVGEHEVIFAGQDEILTISHCAASKAVFASGALSAAVFMRGKPPGLYAMKDLIG